LSEELEGRGLEVKKLRVKRFLEEEKKKKKKRNRKF